MRTITKYQSFDGRDFDTADECRRHENASFALRICGLSIEDVEAALARTNIEFADAIEDALRFRRKALYWRSVGFEDGAKANFWLARSSLRMARSWRVP